MRLAARSNGSFADLAELIRKHELSVILPTFPKVLAADQSPPPEPPPSTAEAPAGRVFGKARR
jgi:hypothetical protein